MSRGQIIATNLFGAPGSTMTRPAGIATEMFGSNVKHSVAENGNNVLENLRIFKVGTFTDMMGFERTWDDLHLAQMVQHFGLLRDGGYLPDVPIRADHSFSIRDVVGYFQDIYLDPTDSQFLSATVEFTEPDAWGKWERGTWRSRSIEIGMYETNDGRAFWPVVMGLAFVDIPAVEGLHARQQSPGHFFHYVTDNEESQVTVPNIQTNPQEWTAAVEYAAWEQAANFAQACQNWEAAVNYAAALEAEEAAQNPPANPPANPPVPAIAGHGAQPPAQPPAQPMSFRVNGQPVSEFARVQAHIDMLEQFRSETVTAGRESFVQELAQNNIIPVTQVPGLQAHAATLTDEQFATFRAMYANAPAAPGLSNFGNQENAQTPPVNGGQGQREEGPGPESIETAKEIVAQHRIAGLSEEKVQKTASYKRLVAAGINP